MWSISANTWQWCNNAENQLNLFVILLIVHIHSVTLCLCLCVYKQFLSFIGDKFQVGVCLCVGVSFCTWLLSLRLFDKSNENVLLERGKRREGTLLSQLPYVAKYFLLLFLLHFRCSFSSLFIYVMSVSLSSTYYRLSEKYICFVHNFNSIKLYVQCSIQAN